jgi:hypothetical protein
LIGIVERSFVNATSARVGACHQFWIVLIKDYLDSSQFIVCKSTLVTATEIVTVQALARGSKELIVAATIPLSILNLVPSSVAITNAHAVGWGL